MSFNIYTLLSEVVSIFIRFILITIIYTDDYRRLFVTMRSIKNVFLNDNTRWYMSVKLAIINVKLEYWLYVHVTEWQYNTHHKGEYWGKGKSNFISVTFIQHAIVEGDSKIGRVVHIYKNCKSKTVDFINLHFSIGM